MNVTAIVCPKCGANLKIEQGRSQCFCEYCGTKILLQNENEFIYRTFDEARIREAELQADIHKREIESKEKKCEMSRGFFKKRIFIYLVLTCIGCAVGSGLMDNNAGVALAFLFPGMIGMACFFYGAIIHGIILLVNSKK